MVSAGDAFGFALIATLVTGLGVGLKACDAGTNRGYWLGCSQGSDQKRQVVIVDDKHRCLPHEQALKARKGEP
jgi:hypothetical protein